MLKDHENYRSFLKSVLSERNEKNKRFSLRAFAANLGMSHSTLSQVMGGSRNLSQAMAVSIAQKLKLSAEEIEYFCLLVSLEAARSEEHKHLLLESINQLRPSEKSAVFNLDVDYFKTISDWYHFAILQLLRIKNFKMTPQSVSMALGISTLDADLALERLERLEVIEKSERNGYIRTDARLYAKSDKKNAALRKFHTQYLEKAVVAFETQDPSERFTGSETFAVSQKALEAIWSAGDEYLKKINDIVSKDESPEEIYHCQINIFKVSRLKKDKK